MTQSNYFEEQKLSEERLKRNTARIKHKIAVISGKGGVGKSTVTANLAMAFAMQDQGLKIGVLDADITGPSIPKILGLHGKQLQAGPPGVLPVTGPLGMKVVSMDFLLPSDDSPVIWRGPLKMGAIKQFLSDMLWGELDYLFIDLPPGTGDEPLSIMQLIPEMDGAIIVTMPSELLSLVVKKAVSFSRRLNVPMIGVIENFSGFICPECGASVSIFKEGGGEKLAKDLSVPFLGKIPIDPQVCSDSDRGVAFISEHDDSPSAKAFRDIVKSMNDFLGT